MKDNKLTQEMKKYVIIATRESQQSWNLPIFESPIVCSQSRELEASDGNMESVAKLKKHKAHSDRVRTSHFVQQI